MSPPRQAKLFARISAAEDRQIARLARRMGKASKQFAVEEALRNYLPVIADAGALIHCALPSLEDSLAREYRIESDIVEGLREVCHAHRWSQNEIIRHAIAAMGDQLGEPR